MPAAVEVIKACFKMRELKELCQKKGLARTGDNNKSELAMRLHAGGHLTYNNIGNLSLISFCKKNGWRNYGNNKTDIVACILLNLGSATVDAGD